MEESPSTEILPAPPPVLTHDDRRSIRREVVRLAWPVVVQSLLRTMMFLVDTYILGHYGDSAKAKHATAAVAIIAPVANSMIMVLSALGVGVLAAVARATGARDPLQQERASATAFAVGSLFALLILPLAVPLLPLVPRLYSVDDPAVWTSASQYLFWTSLSLPFVILEVCGSATLRGAGDTRMPMVFAIVANLLNVAGNYTLVYGRFGAPEMGVAGSGLSTAACIALQGVMTVAWLGSPASAVRLRLRSFATVTRESILRLLRLTGPAVVEPLLLQSGFLIFMSILAGLGITALSSHRAAVSVESIAFMPGFGLAMACGALVGQCLGAGRPDRAEEGFRVSAILSLAVMAAFGIVFLAVPEYIIRFFIPGAPDVERLGATCLRISALELPPLAMALALGGALRGAGDTKTPMIVAFFGIWCVRIPLAYFMAVTLGLGLPGAWLTMVADWSVRVAIFWRLWRRGAWKTTRL